MIKVILVDDERPALRGIEYLMKNYPEVSIIGTYTNPLKAIDEIGRLKPQAVFLDINMPQLQGIDAASKILDLSPETDIIFVTAFDQYAVEAFELHALDYILKPIIPDRFEKTVQRLISKQSPTHNHIGRKLQIKCLGKFLIRWENEEPIKWRTEKTKELFIYLLHNQGRIISKEELIDELWRENEPEKAIRQLYNGIYYIRKALEDYGIDRTLISIDGSYNVKLGPVYWDVKHYYNEGKNTSDNTLEELEEIVAAYTGDYMEGEDFPWAYVERERISKLYLQSLIKLSEIYMEKNQPHKAEAVLLKTYNQDPYEDISTELLLQLYHHRGLTNKAVIHYMAYSKLINEELGIKPHERLQRLYNSIIL